jgi:hypothetical protein
MCTQKVNDVTYLCCQYSLSCPYSYLPSRSTKKWGKVKLVDILQMIKVEIIFDFLQAIENVVWETFCIKSGTRKKKGLDRTTLHKLEQQLQ